MDGSANCELNIDDLEIEDGTYYLKVIIWATNQAHLSPGWSAYTYE